MKKLITAVLVMIFTISAREGRAQTWNEWFRQKKTQKKYLMQQIAALQVYIGYARKGYDIARDGLQTIGDNTGGELGLHSEHFNSLSLVNPELRNHPQVNEILAMRSRIIYDYHNTYEQLRSSMVMSTDELEYVKVVYNRLLTDCQRDVNQLQKVSADHFFVMTDEERLSRINELHSEMVDKYTFSCSFSRDAKLLAASRKKEIKEIENSRKINGIKAK